jgi:hypothetical protein
VESKNLAGKIKHRDTTRCLAAIQGRQPCLLRFKPTLSTKILVILSFFGRVNRLQQRLHSSREYGMNSQRSLSPNKGKCSETLGGING